MIAETIKQIDGLVSERMAKGLSCGGLRFFGLAEPVVRRMNDDVVFPAVVGLDGEGEDVWLDDDYSVGIYHRLLSKQYLPAKKEQYGDDTVQRSVAEMQLVCWAFRSAVKVSADVLERIVYSGFPSGVSAVSSNFDRRSVFSGEFSGIEFNVPNSVMLFSMKYKFAYPAMSRNCILSE